MTLINLASHLRAGRTCPRCIGGQILGRRCLQCGYAGRVIHPPSEPEEPRGVVGLLGWRLSYLHCVDNGAQQLAIRGLYGASITTSTSFRAECGKRAGHAAPDENCTCGFYSASDPSFLSVARPSGRERDNSPVLLRVSAIGRTVLHDYGWRAERIRVDEIYAPYASESIRHALATHFHVVVHSRFPGGCL
jgi:hypothetical protein